MTRIPSIHAQFGSNPSENFCFTAQMKALIIIIIEIVLEAHTHIHTSKIEKI